MAPERIKLQLKMAEIHPNTVHKSMSTTMCVVYGVIVCVCMRVCVCVCVRVYVCVCVCVCVSQVVCANSNCPYLA